MRLFSQSADTSKSKIYDGFALGMSYQSQIGVEFIGVGLYLHKCISVVGLYGNLTGFHQFNPDTSKIQWDIKCGGLTFETAPGTFIYAGFSWGVKRLLDGSVENHPGADIGMIYYPGSRQGRVGMQLGFNTSTLTVTAGLHIGIFFEKQKPLPKTEESTPYPVWHGTEQSK